jgi:hypothetical protein
VNPKPGTSIPRSYRWVLVIALVMGFQVSFSAGFDFLEAVNHDDPPEMVGSESAAPGLGLSAVAQRRVWLARASGARSALEAMLPWRLATSSALAIFAGLVFLMAMRLRIVPEGRVRAAEHLGRAALGAAVLRSIDGAENLAMARTIATEMGKALVSEAIADAELTASMITAAVSLASGAWTLVMVASFVTLGNYFRSETLREALGRAEP